MTLNSRRARFVAEYLVDLNATQAAIRVGYSAKTAKQIASSLLQNPDVADAVAAGQAKRQERTEITQDWVLNNLRRVAERCMQATPVLDRKGEPVLVATASGVASPAYAFDSKGANRSL